MKHQRQPETIARQVGNLMRRFDQALPSILIQTRRSYGFTGEEVGMGVIDKNQVFRTQSCQQLSGSHDFLFNFRPKRFVFQRPHDEGRGDFKSPLTELGPQLVQIRGEIAIRPKFDPLVAGFDNLVQKAIPRSLFGIAREPNSPRVWCAADFDIHSGISLFLKINSGNAAAGLGRVHILL